MNIFEPGDMVIVKIAAGHMDGFQNTVMRLLGEAMPACAITGIPVYGSDDDEMNVEVLGVYRPTKSCVCED